MASREAVSKLTSGGGDWSLYCKQNKNARIDLTIADLRNANLSGMRITNCDLDGADLTGANLDNATLVNCTVSNATLDSVSLIGATLDGARGTDVSLRGAVLRRTKIHHSFFSGGNWSKLRCELLIIDSCDLSHLLVESGELANSRIVKSQVSGLEIEDCTLEGLLVSQCQMRSCRFSASTFDRSRFSETLLHDSVLHRVKLRNCSFLKSELARLSFTDCDVEDCDYAESTLIGLDLGALHLPTAGLLRTALVDCTWPPMGGKTSLTGAYIPNPQLPRQPVQDIDGVSPLLRRQIADAQYIVAKQQSRANLTSQLLFRLWGASSAYGQSLTRLIALAAILIAVHVLLDLGFNGLLFGWHTPNMGIASATTLRFTLAGLGITDDQAKLTPTDSTLITSMRVCGFLLFGVWVGIAATKFSKLGAE